MHELFRPMHSTARSRNGLLSRLGGALARPFQTSYVCPSIMTFTAVAYALRGYEPYWTKVGVPDERGRDPSNVCYRVYKWTEDGRYPTHGVGLSPFVPERLIIAECNARNALARLRGRWILSRRSSLFTSDGRKT
jgi:hypothetical protein